MYNFHYNFMIKKFNTRLLFTDTDIIIFTDTDSLCYEFHEKNKYKIIYKYKELLDLSNFTASSKICCIDNNRHAEVQPHKNKLNELLKSFNRTELKKHILNKIIVN